MDSHGRTAAHGDSTGERRLTLAEWQIAFDATSDGIAVLDPDLRIVRANRTLASWCATSPEALHGRFCYDLFDLADAPPPHCPARQTLDTGTSACAECRMPRLRATCVCTAYPVPTSHSQGAQRVILVAHDVTRLRSAERALGRFLESACEGVWEIDRHGVTVYANARLARLLGYDHPKDLIGRRLYEFHLRTSSGTSLFFDKSREEAGEALECVLRRLDGSDVSVLLSAVTQHDDAGRFTAATLFLTDVTRCRQLETGLRQAEARYQALFENATEAILIHDLSGRFVAANQVTIWRLGYSLEELIELTVADVEVAESTARFSERLDHLQRYRHHLIETMHVTRDGKQIPTEVSSQLIEYDGQPAVLVIARDVTERKQMQQVLVHTERLAAMGQMAAALVHEINNPLQTMLSCVEATLHLPLDDEKRTRYLEVMRHETRRLNAITRRLLDFSRPARLERQPVSILETLDYAVTLTARQLQQARVGLQLSLPETLSPIWASRDELIQVFLNLIINAVEAMPQGGRLRITAAARDDKIEVGLADTGPGFAEGSIDQIFDAFFTTKKNGTGLGLAVSRSIVEQHGGTLTAENIPTGGALFTVLLPAQ